MAEYFCSRVSGGDFRDIAFFFGGVAKAPRVILKGKLSEVMALVNGYEQGSART